MTTTPITDTPGTPRATDASGSIQLPSSKQNDCTKPLKNTIMTNDAIPDLCPACGSIGGVHGYRMLAADFVAENRTTPVIAKKILDDENTLDFNACEICGFKWIPNDAVASTTQVRFYIVDFADAIMHGLDMDSQLAAFIRFLRHEIGKPIDDNMFTTRSKGSIIAETTHDVFQYVKGARVEKLLQLYNDLCGLGESLKQVIPDTDLPAAKDLDITKVLLTDSE